MALVGNDLYVADTDALLRFPYHARRRPRSPRAGVKVTDLPARLDQPPLDQERHRQRRMDASSTSRVGSNSNVAENGIEAEQERAAIWEVDRDTGRHRILASGLRNPVGMALASRRARRCGPSVNERDELGSDLVPDYMTAVKDGAFYGWPYSYYGQHVDARVTPQRPDLVAQAIAPDYALGPHTASLGLTFAHAGNLPAGFASGAFVGQHGSWNRKPASGYKVIFVPLRRRQARRRADRRADRLPRRRRQGARPPGRRHHRQIRRAARRRRRRQPHLARDGDQSMIRD